ncbi:alpha/beta-hydrolase [Agrocybe pediades]|nr:alpha/beta-hydrolase [Agrocybe pediades]
MANTKHCSILTLSDGAKLAYEILGSHHINRTVPIVLICGMTSVRVDFERLTQSLTNTRPVLIYDHRGMGDSSLTHDADEDITIELMARDLAALLTHLQWKEVALCGFSMGGVIAQQMLVLPFDAKAPVSIPFSVTHLLLAGTRSVVQEGAGLKIPPLAPNATRTPEEKKIIAWRVASALVDPKWQEENSERFKYIVQRAINPEFNRPPQIIAKQRAALQQFYFANKLDQLSRAMQVLIVHGQLDQVIPFSCAEQTLRCIPHARLLEQGSSRGQVPTLNFGHFWFEYFDIAIWHNVIDTFVGV